MCAHVRDRSLQGPFRAEIDRCAGQRVCALLVTKVSKLWTTTLKLFSATRTACSKPKTPEANAPYGRRHDTIRLHFSLSRCRHMMMRACRRFYGVAVREEVTMHLVQTSAVLVSTRERCFATVICVCQTSLELKTVYVDR